MAVHTTQKSATREVQEIIRDLTRENRPQSPLVTHLRRQVANAFVMYMNYKHYHWQTFGPHFRELHKLFDKFAEEVHETIDPLAERTRMIGQDPPGTLAEIQQLATVTNTTRAVTMRDMIQEARRNALIVIE